MSTSLAEQLRRLKTPQTSHLSDSKKRASILFDWREAAEKDRETIFDIGLSGLQELTAISPSFAQFEATLFDKNTVELQRAVESASVNQHLNVSIKKFMVHLSPYFLLQPTHKCLEWLIRRFHIHDYNKDELMMLILPYHETRMFIKCVQLMRLNDPADKWHWLEKIQKPGVPLSKQALLNRASSDNFFLRFIVDSTIYAVEEMGSKSNHLQVAYAFFCTSLIGALELAQINETHITNAYKAIKKGLKSTSVDFCAASLMIIGQMVSKTKLSNKFLSRIVGKLASVPHQSLQSDILILLVLLFKSQEEMIQDVPSEAAQQLAAAKWVPSALGKIYAEGINILPFFLPLLSECLKNVQLRGESRKESQKFVDSILKECSFKPEHVEKVIRCVLDSYILCEKLEDSVIMIESDNEEGNSTAADNSVVNGWYTNLLKKLERQYSNVFDRVVKEIMRSNDSTLSTAKRNSLKTVLGFLFTVVCTDDNVNIFEKLYHHNAQHRIEAVKYLVKNMEKMCFSDDSKDLLKDSIAERLGDDSPNVVIEALKFNTTSLIKIVGRKELLEKLIAILENTQKKPSIWEATGFAALKHLTTSSICTLETCEVILIAVLPFLLQSTSLDFNFVHQIINSALAKHVQFIRKCKDTISEDEHKESGHSKIMDLFERKQGLPAASHILSIIRHSSESEMSNSKAFYAMLLLAYSIRKNCPPELSLKILDVIALYDRIKETHVCENSKWMVNVAMGVYPLNLNIACIKNIVDNTNFGSLKLEENRSSFAHPSTPLVLLHKIFDILMAGIVKHQEKPAKLQLFKEGLDYMVAALLPTIGEKIEFFSNYFIIDTIEAGPAASSYISTDSKLQVNTIRYFNAVLNEANAAAATSLSLSAFIRILSSLRSSRVEVREAAFETLQALSKIQFEYSPLVDKLLQRKDEILMDENQLGMILFTISQKSGMKNIFDKFIAYIANEDSDLTLIALLLGNLTHVNNAKVLEKVAIPAANVLRAAAELGTKQTILDSCRTHIIHNVLLRYTADTIQLVRKSKIVWEVLLKAIESHRIFLSLNGKTISVSTIAVQNIDDEIFNNLTLDHQKLVLHAAIQSATLTESIDAINAISKFLKQINVDANVCINLLNEMTGCRVADAAASAEPIDVDGNQDRPARRRRAVAPKGFAPLPEILKRREWICGVTWLEQFQNKKKLTNAQLLVPPLFSILQKCLEFEEQSSVEYVKQLALSSILHACILSASGTTSKRQQLPDSVFKVELIVQCIRGSPNPQTHHHALQLLAHTAKILPDQVLHNMMDIFTFMGSSIVRHDDAYSFQIITDIITAIIPTLIKANQNKTPQERNALVVPVLKVFSDIVLDVPVHRRIPLYMELINTLGAQNHLWMFLAVLFESHIIHGDKEKKSPKSDEMPGDFPKRIEIALALANEYDPATIIITSTKLIEFLQKLPANKPTNSTEKPDNEVALIFNVANYSSHHFRHYKYIFLHFISNLTSSPSFINKVAAHDESENQQMKPHYQNAIIKVLMFIPEVSRTTESLDASDTKLIRYWKVILHNCYDILDNVISLLSPNTFLNVMKGLLSHKLSGVRRKVIELLINKLQNSPEFLNEVDEENLVALLAPLTDIVETIASHDNAQPENVALQQMSLICAKLMSKHLAQKYPADFKKLIEILIEIIRNSEQTPRIILAAVILCLAEICANLRAQSISYLSRFMPKLIKVLQSQLDSAQTPADSILCSIVTGLLKIIETLPLFLSPYLVDLLVRLSQIWHRIQSDTKQATTLNRLTVIWKKLANTLPLRVFIPTIDQTYTQLIKNEQYNGIGPLMELLTLCFENVKANEVTQFMPDLTTFFITALQFRSDQLALELSVVNELEAQMIKAFVALILKLSEGNFRPLFKKIYDWATEEADNSEYRAITFFRFSCEIAKALKSLFILFCGDFIEDAAKLLVKFNTTSDDTNVIQQIGEDKCALLIDSIVDTLYHIFLYDTQGFVSLHRFQILLEPLVDQIENDLILARKASQDQLTLCLAQFGVAANDDTMWKQLNHHILLKTRNNPTQYRLFALRVCVELASRLGDDYLPLLPETVPFLSELLEDEDSLVETQCRKSVQELERILDEPLQKYF